jgi:hypothetical protein
VTETLHDPWTDRLSEYLDDGLEAPERAALEEHLRHCSACRAVLEDLRRVTRVAAGLRDRDPGDALWPEIARRIGAPELALPPVRDELAARRKLHVPWLRWGAAAAAVLVLGIGIGRFSAGPTPTLPTARVEAPAPGSSPGSDPYRVAAVQHLGRADALLTTFRADAADGRADQAVSAWADDLLLNTRLLLDSPASRDPRLRGLLEDLELVLAQIAQLPQQPPTRTEVDLAEDALEQSRVLPRLRTLVPSGSMNESTRGES